MNLRDLEYLVAVSDLNNFSKAAEKCYVSQPTLSGQLKKMEETLGAVLIERSTRKVLFTPVGENIVAKAREILMLIDSIKEIAISDADELCGDFHIGFIPTVGPFLLPLIMPIITKAYPKINVFLHKLKAQALMDKLISGELDFMIAAKQDWQHSVVELPLYQEPILLAVSDQHPFAKHEQISISELRDQAVLMLEDGHCLRDQALALCLSAGASEDHRFRATSIDTLLHMVATGIGMTFVPELARNLNIDGVKYISLEGGVSNREIVMLTRNKNPRYQALTELAKLIAMTVSEQTKLKTINVEKNTDSIT